jgi:hypothetical protein
MISIALFHKHYDKDHLNEVKEIMKEKGAPVIRAMWSDLYGMWLAVEGCHRIRAAKELGLTPIIKDVSNQKTVTFQMDCESVKKSASKLLYKLNEDASKTTIIDFEEEND